MLDSDGVKQLGDDEDGGAYGGELLPRLLATTDLKRQCQPPSTLSKQSTAETRFDRAVPGGRSGSKYTCQQQAPNT